MQTGTVLFDLTSKTEFEFNGMAIFNQNEMTNAIKQHIHFEVMSFRGLNQSIRLFVMHRSHITHELYQFEIFHP